MKPTHDEQRELLEDIFTTEGHGRSISAAEVMKLVEAERRSRNQRRRGIAMAAAAIVGLAVMLNSVRSPQKPEPSSSLVEKAPDDSAPAAVVASAAITPPKVEHVDDEGMLAMLGKQPTALVRWPDGRQTLLLLAK